MIGIIGAGISGLSLAFYLKKKGISCQVLEASATPGGYIRSQREGAYLFDQGPNSILADEELMELFSELGLQSEIQPANPVSKHRFIYKNGAYRKLPSAPPSLLFNGFFSLGAKLSLWKERNIHSLSPANETLSGFFKRRFCQEIVDYALNPFVAGIYAGDPSRLLVDKTFPQLVDFEHKYGSVIRGLMKNKSTSRKESLNFRDGMQTLPLALARQLNIAFNSPVNSIERRQDHFEVTAGTKNYTFSRLVICVPAPVAAQLLGSLYPDFAAALHRVEYPPMAVIHTVFKKSQVNFDLDGFGGLHPKCENRFSAGAIWTSSVFKGRCPEDEVLFTSFVGGSLYTEQASRPQGEVLQHLNTELKEVYQISGEPVMQKFFLWKQAIPQYTQEINAVYEQATALEKDRLYVCTNWKDGVSLSDCIKKGKKLAQLLAG